jgi:hypothetical protein
MGRHGRPPDAERSGAGRAASATAKPAVAPSSGTARVLARGCRSPFLTLTNPADLCCQGIAETAFFAMDDLTSERRRMFIPSQVEVRGAPRSRIGEAPHSRPVDIIVGIRRSFHQEFPRHTEDRHLNSSEALDCVPNNR